MILDNPRDIKELSTAMGFFLAPENLESASDAARKTASKYSVQENHRRMLEIFNECVRTALP